MNSTGQMDTKPSAEEVAFLSSSSSSTVTDNIPLSSQIMPRGGTDPSEGCLIDLTDEYREATCNISSSSMFISTDLNAQQTSHPEMNVCQSVNTNGIKTRGQSSTDVLGQSLAYTLLEDFHLKHSLCSAITGSQRGLDISNHLSAAKTNDCLTAITEKQENVDKTAVGVEAKDVCSIQNESICKNSEIALKKISAGQLLLQADVGQKSSCNDLFSREIEAIHCWQYDEPHCFLAKAAPPWNHLRLSPVVKDTKIPQHVRLPLAVPLGTYIEVPHLVSSDSREFATYSQDIQKCITPEPVKAFSVPRTGFLTQYLYPETLSTPVSWSTAFIQDKGWRRATPGSFMWRQAPTQLPVSSNAVNAMIKTGTSNCTITEASATSPWPSTPDCHRHPASGYSKVAAAAGYDQTTVAALPCLISPQSAASLAIGFPSPLQSEAYNPRPSMTPIPSAGGKSALDQEVSGKQEESSGNMFPSLPAQTIRDSLLKSAEKRKALLCNTVDVYGHNQPRCYVPSVSNRPYVTESPVNSRVMTCQSSVSDQPASCVTSPVQDVSQSSLQMKFSPSSLSHKGPGHQCSNMNECTICVLAFSKELALALASDVMLCRTANRKIPSGQQSDSCDQNAKKTIPFAQKLTTQH